MPGADSLTCTEINLLVSAVKEKVFLIEPLLWLPLGWHGKPFRTTSRRPSASSPCGEPGWRPGGTEADDARQSLQQCHEAVSLVSPRIVTTW